MSVLQELQERRREARATRSEALGTQRLAAQYGDLVSLPAARHSALDSSLHAPERDYGRSRATIWSAAAVIPSMVGWNAIVPVGKKPQVHAETHGSVVAHALWLALGA